MNESVFKIITDTIFLNIKISLFRLKILRNLSKLQQQQKRVLHKGFYYCLCDYLSSYIFKDAILVVKN